MTPIFAGIRLLTSAATMFRAALSFEFLSRLRHDSQAINLG